MDWVGNAAVQVGSGAALMFVGWCGHAVWQWWAMDRRYRAWLGRVGVWLNDGEHQRFDLVTGEDRRFAARAVAEREVEYASPPIRVMLPAAPDRAPSETEPPGP